MSTVKSSKNKKHPPAQASLIEGDHADHEEAANEQHQPPAEAPHPPTDPKIREIVSTTDVADLRDLIDRYKNEMEVAQARLTTAETHLEELLAHVRANPMDAYLQAQKEIADLRAQLAAKSGVRRTTTKSTGTRTRTPSADKAELMSKVHAFVTHHPSSSNGQIAEGVGIEPKSSALKSAVAALKADGKLTMSGGRKTAVYSAS
jgi:hypothetical protein